MGSAALQEACRRNGIEGPAPDDLDLSWALGVDEGQALLERHGIYQPTTDHNRARGTLAFRHGSQRIEITSFRAGYPSSPLDERIEADLGGRDMTIGAIAIRLADDRLFDPFGGVAHWRERRIEPVGDPVTRIQEHPVRWLRYYRKAHVHGFEVGPAIRKVRPIVELLDQIPREALGAEFRSALLDLASPGRLLVDWYEAGTLEHIAPDLAAQFGGMPAGPQRYHPELGQALHMVLALEWAAAESRHLEDADRLAVLIAVLCHDLGKRLTRADEYPSHRGHERRGVPLVGAFLDGLPGLADPRARRLAEHVCALHLDVRRMDEMRRGTLVELYERWFKTRDYPVDLFALALGADVGGRLGQESAGREVATRVARDLTWLRDRCGSVDARTLREQHEDLDRFRQALHEARCAALRDS